MTMWITYNIVYYGIIVYLPEIMASVHEVIIFNFLLN